MDLETPIAVHDAKVLFHYEDIPPIQEDRSWYGLLGFVLVFIITPIQLVQGIRQRDPYRVGMVVVAFSYSILVIALDLVGILTREWYFIPVVASTAPFLASLVDTGLVGKPLESYSHTMLYTCKWKPFLSFRLLPFGIKQNDDSQYFP